MEKEDNQLSNEEEKALEVVTAYDDKNILMFFIENDHQGEGNLYPRHLHLPCINDKGKRALV
jgi:hypothetical protein